MGTGSIWIETLMASPKTSDPSSSISQTNAKPTRPPDGVIAAVITLYLGFSIYPDSQDRVTPVQILVAMIPAASSAALDCRLRWCRQYISQLVLIYLQVTFQSLA